MVTHSVEKKNRDAVIRSIWFLKITVPVQKYKILETPKIKSAKCILMFKTTLDVNLYFYVNET